MLPEHLIQAIDAAAEILLECPDFFNKYFKKDKNNVKISEMVLPQSLKFRGATMSIRSAKEDDHPLGSTHSHPVVVQNDVVHSGKAAYKYGHDMSKVKTNHMIVSFQGPNQIMGKTHHAKELYHEPNKLKKFSDQIKANSKENAKILTSYDKKISQTNFIDGKI